MQRTVVGWRWGVVLPMINIDQLHFGLGPCRVGSSSSSRTKKKTTWCDLRFQQPSGTSQRNKYLSDSKLQSLWPFLAIHLVVSWSTSAPSLMSCSGSWPDNAAACQRVEATLHPVPDCSSAHFPSYHCTVGCNFQGMVKNDVRLDTPNLLLYLISKHPPKHAFQSIPRGGESWPSNHTPVISPGNGSHPVHTAYKDTKIHTQTHTHIDLHI